ncbi:MAG: type III secretion system chaperone [Succinivibrionaceae bacterium]|nr:type III secretion system chaperone [Succinivibrionaceae bacterium]
MSPETLVSNLNAYAGLGLELDADGATTFEYQGRRVLLRFLGETGLCLFCSELGTLDPAAGDEALATLLEANLLLSDSLGGGISMDPETRMASINFMIPTGESGDPEAFAREINEALYAADHWAQRLGQINEASAGARPAPAAGVMLPI